MTIILLIIVFSLLFLWVLNAPLTAQPTAWLSWPIACSTRGCITTGDWQEQIDLTQAFAAVSGESPPDIATTLTTLIRQHLSHYANPVSDVTLADAARYRENILNISSTEQLRETLPLTLAEYDKQVVLPYLEQESVRHRQRAEDAEDLYIKLASERWIVIFPFNLSWNAETATVVTP